ncbi:MAG TPA: LuxR C-terminal-related transcriptional regulator, partial [Roseiflexaceae bacterium]
NAAEAGGRYAQSLALFRDIGHQWGVAASLINLGQLASARGSVDAAARLLQEALRLALSTHSAPQVAQILAAFAPIVRGRGEPGWPHELARFAAAESASLERCQPHADRLLAWAAALPLPTLDQAIDVAQQPRQAIERGAQPAPAAPGPKAYPAGLTAREVAVLRLVAQGLTDAQVAEKLVLSPRTVSTHLTSIYGKLQVNSRSAATRFAVEQGLV